VYFVNIRNNLNERALEKLSICNDGSANSNAIFIVFDKEVVVVKRPVIAYFAEILK
jgi:hypothetical protein